MSSKWQPIETAPNDGTPFLVWMPEEIFGSKVQVWSHRRKNFTGSIAGQMAFDLPSPIHWQPLPEPPETSNQ